MSSASRSDNGDAGSADADTGSDAPIISTIISTATPSRIAHSFVTPTPVDPALLKETGQRIDHFASVPIAKEDGSNFREFSFRWSIGAKSAGIAHLFDEDYVPPEKPTDPSSSTYEDDLKAYNAYTRLENTALLLLSTKLTTDVAEAVVEEAGRVYDVWVKIIKKLAEKSEIYVTLMKNRWAAQSCDSKENLRKFLEDSDKTITTIRIAGGKDAVTEAERRSHVLAAIPAEYKKFISTIIKSYHLSTGKILPTQKIVETLIGQYEYLHAEKAVNSTMRTSAPREVVLAAAETGGGYGGGQLML